jgi:hypothetical protein
MSLAPHLVAAFGGARSIMDALRPWVEIDRCSRCSCRERRRPWPQIGDQPQDLGKQRPRHGNLGHLEDEGQAAHLVPELPHDDAAEAPWAVGFGDADIFDHLRLPARYSIYALSH